MSKGRVSIVGAGPGDPELITVKALRAIQSADVILYDRLVNTELLNDAPVHCQRIYCGKSPGHHPTPQPLIEQMLIQHARAGKHVVRLKGGDPFVFGRGGEEALALCQAGITYQIIPGITSAIGAGGSALIPMTHRGAAASWAIVTGSQCENKQSSARWDLLAHGVDTLVIYMGVSQLEQTTMELLKHGKPASTPIALIENGTLPHQRVFTGTLEEMSKLAVANQVSNPALVVIGEVVRVRDQLLLMEREVLYHIG